MAEIMRSWALELATYARNSGFDLVALIRGGELAETAELIGVFDIDFDGAIAGTSSSAARGSIAAPTTSPADWARRRPGTSLWRSSRPPRSSAS